MKSSRSADMLVLHHLPSRYRSQWHRARVLRAWSSGPLCMCQCCVLCKRKHARECDVRGVGVARQVKAQPHETLFRVGDSSEAGIFIVVEGRLGVFLQALRRLCFWPSGQLPDVLC